MASNSSETKSNSVYIVSLVITIAVVAWGLVSPDSFGAFAKALNGGLTKYYGWGYLLTMNIFVAFCLFIGCSRFGKMRLGPEDSRPEYSNLSWVAMLFSAGMGVGLVFYGAAEPLFYFGSTPLGAEPGSIQAARDAMQITVFHWGLHPWAGYSVIALPLAYYQFRHNAPGLISTIFIPLVGEERVRGAFGKTVDILAIFATLAGLPRNAPAQQRTQRALRHPADDLCADTHYRFPRIPLHRLCGARHRQGNQVRRRLEHPHLLRHHGGALLRRPILNSTVMSFGDYISGLIKESFMTAPYGGGYEDHLRNWTLYYWAWWIAWAPFSGSFIARISRGRTIREFIAGVLIVPALGSLTWFGIFGTSALKLELVDKINISAAVLQDDISVGIFKMFLNYTGGFAMSILMLVLIVTFFVTSANSGTYVLSMYSTEGSMNPPKSKMFVWGILMGALAVVLLLTGGLQNLQTVSLAAAMPFSIIMLCSCAAFYKVLLSEEKKAQLK